jgi:hypothetical protein
MKISILFCLIVSAFIFTSATTGCNEATIHGSGKVVTDNRPLTGFSAISAGGAIDLTVSTGKDFSVQVVTDDNILPYVETSVKGSELEIGMKEHFWFSDAKVKVTVTLPKLESIALAGASHGKVDGVNAQAFQIEVSGASKLVVAGTASKANCEVSGASSLVAKDLLADNVSIESSGASHARVYAGCSITADASGASKIIYFGNPKSISQDVSGASKVVDASSITEE